MKKFNKKLNIIYLCITEKGPSGGVKTVYKHSEIINNLKKNFTSQILHIKKKKYKKWSNSIKKILKGKKDKFHGWKFNDIDVCKNFKFNFLSTKIKIRNDFNFNKKEDFLIIPEIFAHFANDLCIKKSIPYAIFVQNGYCLNPTNDYSSLNKAYKNAKFILSYSKDISACIELAFPDCKNKILKTNVSVDASKFNFNVKKINMITYMPRKLPTHSDNLRFFVRKNLPKSWKLMPLHNLSERNVFKYLLKSKIFLSFSNMEGLGIPPIEAAIAGNKVIGYPGRGGSEYWKKPIFIEIEHGNIAGFIKEIYKNIKNKNLLKELKTSRKSLIKKYSLEQEKNHINKMIKKILFLKR